VNVFVVGVISGELFDRDWIELDEEVRNITATATATATAGDGGGG